MCRGWRNERRKFDLILIVLRLRVLHRKKGTGDRGRKAPTRERHAEIGEPRIDCPGAVPISNNDDVVDEDGVCASAANKQSSNHNRVRTTAFKDRMVVVTLVHIEHGMQDAGLR